MTFDLKSISPSPNDWFTTEIEYEGQGRADFLDPQGTVEGPVKVHFDEFGESSIEMNVDKVTSEQPLEMGIMQLLSGQRPRKEGRSLVLGIGLEHNHCTRLVVASQSGTFSTSGNIHFSYQLGTNTLLRFHPTNSQFDAVGEEVAKYWVLPLSNFLSDFRQHHPILDRHPLRIYPTPNIPDDLSESDMLLASLVADNKNRLIIFEFIDGLGFIEPLPDYDIRKDKLLSGRGSNTITAVMVGEVGGKPIECYEDLGQWLPFDYLRLLGLATGSEVGAPWIELRDTRARLVRRFHVSLAKPSFARGCRAIDEVINAGTGYLLTRSVSSPNWGQSCLRVAIKHATRGGLLEQIVLEDRLSHLCRGFETLCRYFGLSKQQLLGDLDTSQRKHVEAILNSAVQQIGLLAQSATAAGKREQVRRLRRIEQRIQSASSVEKAFGLAVVDLLKKFGLPDADIVDMYYKANPRTDGQTTWSNVLSYYRGVVVHEGYFDIAGERHDVDDILRIINHLHDILVRILFKMLDYDQTYDPTVAKATDQKLVDWVKPDTPASQLGYE